MTILFMDSFDHYTTVLTKWSTNTCTGTSCSGYVNTTLFAGAGRWGTAGLRHTGAPSAFGWTMTTTKYVGGTSATMVMGTSWVYTGVPQGTILSFWEGSTTHVDLCVDVNGRMFVTRNGTNLSLGTTAVYSSSANYYVEMKATVHDSAGVVEVRVNGVTVLSGTGLDTRNGGTGVINTVALGGTSQVFGYVPGSPTYTYDDVYVCDVSGSAPNNDFLGDTRVEYLVPTAAGVRTQFASTGTNWQTVDETIPSDADYNSSRTPGDMDLFTMSNLSGNGLVYGVQTIARVAKDDAGTRAFKPIFYKASGWGDTGRYYPVPQSPTSAVVSYIEPYLLGASPDYDPGVETAKAWTVDEINALQFGYAVGDAELFTLDARLV